MRRPMLGLVAVLSFGCSDAANTEITPQGGANAEGGAGGTGGSSNSGGSGTGAGPSGIDPLDFPSDDDFDEDATVDDGLDPTVTAPLVLVADDGRPNAITRDDRVVYSGDALWSVKVAAGAPPRKAASVSGTSHVFGRTIFNFADVDYELDTGYLTFWTPAIGRRTVGDAILGADKLAARHDDAWVMFARNPMPDTLDIVICSADKQHAAVLVEGAGRGGEFTCSPTFGFAGDAAVVGWCEVDSLDATLARFTLGADMQWQREDISHEARGSWTSDAVGERLFYITSGSEGRITDMTDDESIGDNVGWGLFHPDGRVFFTVSDQLRMRDQGVTVPIVVDGFNSPVAWSDDYEQVVYSDEVVYEDGVKQDLSATPTSWFNPTPTVLEANQIATLTRSVLTRAGGHVLYLTGVSDTGATLAVRPIDGAPGINIAGVFDMVAAHDSVVVFTNNRTPPDTYPVIIDMRVFDAASGGPAQLLEAATLESDIQIRSDGLVVVYRRDGEMGGLWARPIP